MVSMCRSIASQIAIGAYAPFVLVETYGTVYVHKRNRNQYDRASPRSTSSMYTKGIGISMTVP